MVRKFQKIWLVFVLFCAIFAPPFFDFNCIYILSIIAVFYFARNHKPLLCIKNNNTFYKLIGIGTYIVFNIIFHEIINSGGLFRIRIVTIYQLFVLIPMQFIVSRYVIELGNENHFTEVSFLKICLFSGMIEGVLVILAFFSPSIRNIFINAMLQHGASKKIYGDSYFLSYRAYGYADTLLDTFGYGMGILSGICLLYPKLGNIRFICMFIFLFSTLVNSRTGLAIFLIAVVIFLFKGIRKHSFNKWAKSLIAFIVLLFISIIAINTNFINERTLGWIKSGFRSIVDFLTGTKSEYSLGSMQNSMFTARFWKIPNNIFGLIFGMGHSVYGTSSIIGIASDVGYINYIWICGIFGTGILLYIILRLFGKSIKRSISKDMKFVRIFLCISFFIMFIKGNVLTHTAGTFLTILVCTYRRDRSVSRNICINEYL